MIVKLGDKLQGRPSRPAAAAAANRETLAFLAGTECRDIAEIGCEWGSTSIELATWLDNRGTLHLFDYAERVEAVRDRLNAQGYRNVVAHGNSHRTLDSYNWSLMKLLQEHATPIFDYVYLDGAHTWAHDALALLLVDRLLRPGGYLDFDDYHWSYGKSPTVNPAKWPQARVLFTDEQIDAEQVKLIVELLVRRDPRYEELVPDKIFRKTR
jgi:predicted O-methyltransferase YrrM